MPAPPGMRPRRRPGSERASMPPWRSARARRTSTTSRWRPRGPAPSSGGWPASPMRACCGRSSSTITWSRIGSTAIPTSRRRRRSASTGATPIGTTCSIATSSRCRTSGNIPGTPPGISPSTRYPWRASIRSSPRTSCCCSCANGTCIRMGSCRPTSSPSAMSIRRCTPGRPGASTASPRPTTSAARRGPGTPPSSRRCSRSC